MSTSPGRARTVAVIGCGYVGYPLALVLVDAGYTVTAIDTDPSVVDAINEGVPRRHEADVQKLAVEVRETGRLTAASQLTPSDVYVIAVPTPLDSSGRRPDLGAVEAATRTIARVISEGELVVVESTVPPGTTERRVKEILAASGIEPDRLLVAHCPERVFPGNTVEELLEAPRVVGGTTPAATAEAAAFYRSFVTAPVTETTATAAELSKLMENAHRDVNIALTNEVSEIARAHGVDPYDVIEIANLHPRVEYLRPGIGVGGHCIPVDPWFLTDDDDGVIAAARRLNDDRPGVIAKGIAAQLRAEAFHSVLIIGTAYKPDVIDERNAPALAVATHLRESGFDVTVTDPTIPERVLDLGDALASHDAYVVLVPHRHIESLIAEASSPHTRAIRLDDPVT